MGTTLTGTTPQDTYDSLIKVTDNGPLSGTAKYLSDGLGNDSALAVSTAAVGVGTTTIVSGTKLTVGGPIAAVGSASTMATFETSDSACYIGLKDSSGSLTYLGSDNGAFLIQTPSSGYSTKLTLTDAGNVGIGTSSPTSLLSIAPANDASDTLRVFRGKDSGFEQQSAIIDVVGGNLNIKARATDLLRYISFQLSGNGGSSYTQAARIDYDGLKFGSDTAAANALDDYEEGTWTPSLVLQSGSVTYTTQTGTYTKIGRQVVVRMRIEVNVASSPSGTLEVAGMPFIAASGTIGSISVFPSGLAATASQVVGTVTGVSTTMRLYDYASGNVTNRAQDLQNGSSLDITATYFV